MAAAVCHANPTRPSTTTPPIGSRLSNPNLIPPHPRPHRTAHLTKPPIPVGQDEGGNKPNDLPVSLAAFL
jgi:hypothetical protein